MVPGSNLEPLLPPTVPSPRGSKLNAKSEVVRLCLSTIVFFSLLGSFLLLSLLLISRSSGYGHVSVLQPLKALRSWTLGSHTAEWGVYAEGENERAALTDLVDRRIEAAKDFASEVDASPSTEEPVDVFEDTQINVEGKRVNWFVGTLTDGVGELLDESDGIDAEAAEQEVLGMKAVRHLDEELKRDFSS